MQNLQHEILAPPIPMKYLRRANMILKLQREWTTDPERSFVVGDRDTDVQAAIAAGVAGYKFEGGNLLEFLRPRISSGRRVPA